ncbi:MAG: undecaprenyl-diphosphate phosphatase, partial [Gemmatimonadales bacterium]
MTLWQGIVLGVVQGLTEFLPVSSDGHLVLMGTLLGVPTPGVFVEVALHVATLAAVLVVFGRRLLAVGIAALRGRPAELRYALLLALAIVPAGIVGVGLRDLVARTYDSLWFAGIGFLITGTVLWTTRRERGEGQVPGTAAALGIGIGQALAILPGVSRSGLTVSVGLWARLTPAAAAEFSFLLAVPTIAGAAFVELPEARAGLQTVGVLPLAVSCLVAFGSGIFAIRWLLLLLQRGHFHA